MSINQIQTSVTAKVWQAIAQSGIDTSSIDQEDMNKLVTLVVDAALGEVDIQLDQFNQESEPEVAPPTDDDLEEEILWQGRPFLSLTVSYTITSERIRIAEGLLAREWTDIELVRIQNMDYKQSVTERTVNVGDIFINSHSHGGTPPDLILENVKNPQQVHEILRKAVLKAREKYRLSYREEM